MSKIILDLCGGTGAWSKPYADDGYDVRVITLPQDVRSYTTPNGVYGVLAAPPCTEFAGSGARWWKSKDQALIIEAVEIVMACMNIISASKPEWWCLENPVGRLPKFIGKWKHTFNPCDFGDEFTKRTCLWGEFNMPEKIQHECKHPVYPGHRLPPSPERAALRSVTPPGFANAFKEANP